MVFLRHTVDRSADSHHPILDLFCPRRKAGGRRELIIKCPKRFEKFLKERCESDHGILGEKFGTYKPIQEQELEDKSFEERGSKRQVPNCLMPGLHQGKAKDSEGFFRQFKNDRRHPLFRRQGFNGDSCKKDFMSSKRDFSVHKSEKKTNLEPTQKDKTPLGWETGHIVEPFTPERDSSGRESSGETPSCARAHADQDVSWSEKYDADEVETLANR